MIRVRAAKTNEDHVRTAELLRGFPIHQRVFYAANIAIVSRYFDAAAYEQEMVDLAAVYGPPGGCVLMAMEDEQLVGAVCMHRLDQATCEMKRLFVPAEHRRKGIAQALCMALLDDAREKGYALMRLDTGTFMVESQALYRKLGFQYIQPYYAVADDLRDGLVYLELEL